MNSTPIERTECPICGSRPRVLPGARSAQARLCTACEHTFVRTLPSSEALGELYDTYGYDADVVDLPAFLDAILAEVVARFERFRQTRRMLDVGFGAGGLLRVARAKGWEPHGVELSRASVERARAADIGEVQLGDFREVPLEPGSFDVVVMSELVEHLPDPEPYLARAAEVLRPGGLLYATTPHGRGLSGRLLGASWSVLRPPEHLQLFSRKSLSQLVTAAGFREVHVYTQGLLPHELIAKLRPTRATRREPTADGAALQDATCDRTTNAFALNEKLTTRPAGRAMKTLANAMLRVTTLGDSLRLEAIR